MASLSGFTEMAIGIVIVLVCLSIVVTGMNSTYHQGYDTTFGIGHNVTKTYLDTYPATLETGIQGEATTNAINGVNVVTSWQIIRSGIQMIWDIISGGIIQNAVALLQLGQAGIILGWGLRLLFIFAMGFVLIKILFKVKP